MNITKIWNPIHIAGVLWPHHPEQQPGEVYVGTYSEANPDDYETIDYVHKRKGRIAYDSDSNIIEGQFPIFIWRTEYEARHKEVTVEIGH